MPHGGCLRLLDLRDSSIDGFRRRDASQDSTNRIANNSTPGCTKETNVAVKIKGSCACQRSLELPHVRLQEPTPAAAAKTAGVQSTGPQKIGQPSASDHQKITFSDGCPFCVAGCDAISRYTKPLVRAMDTSKRLASTNGRQGAPSAPVTRCCRQRTLIASLSAVNTSLCRDAIKPMKALILKAPLTIEQRIGQQQHRMGQCHRQRRQAHWQVCGPRHDKF